jgi:predicted nucleic acid-binding protein
MIRTIILDTGPLGLVTHRGGKPEVDECKKWLGEVDKAGSRIVVPEIADYELRRELLRAGKAHGVLRLDALIAASLYAPLTTKAMRLAAEMWSQVRQQRLTTAPDHALDGDVILAAQAKLMELDGFDVVVATTNVGHLSRLVKADLWRNIT